MTWRTIAAWALYILGNMISRVGMWLNLKGWYTPYNWAMVLSAETQQNHAGPWSEPLPEPPEGET